MLTAMMCLALVAVSCGKNATHINVDHNIALPATSGTDSITVDADGEWEAETQAQWIELLPTKDRLVIAYQPNETGQDRLDTISIVSGDIQSKIVVRQRGMATYLRTSKNSVTLPMKGGKTTVKVDCDGNNIEVSCLEFPVTLHDGVLTITAASNDGGGLLGEVSLKCDTCVCYVQIIQQGNTCMLCAGEGKIKCPKCHGTYHSSEVCPECQGAGYQVCCEGTGRAYCQENHLADCKVVCPECRGNGHDFNIEEEEEE